MCAETYLLSPRPLDYHAPDVESFLDVQRAGSSRLLSLTHALAGFQIPALPTLRVEQRGSNPLAPLLHRFALYLRALHDPTGRRAIALHVVAHPDRAVLGAEVGIYLLCRVAEETPQAATLQIQRLARQVEQLFPTEALFPYPHPIRLKASDVEALTFQTVPDHLLTVAELRKFEDVPLPHTQATAYIPEKIEGLDYLAHPFWPDTSFDPWLTLIEGLAKQSHPTAITITLEPTALVEYEAAVVLAQQFDLMVEEGSQRAALLDQAAQHPATTPRGSALTLSQLLSRARAFRAQGLTHHMIGRARRGRYVYEQYLAEADHLFGCRISLSAAGPLPDGLLQALRVALVASSGATPETHLGWMRPEIVYPAGATEEALARRNLRWLAQVEWGASLTNVKLRRLRTIVTAQEAVALFHLPMMPQAGQTSALSTAEVPFVLPPEVLTTKRFKAGERLVQMGYLYQKGIHLAPNQAGVETEVRFEVPLSDLEKPSLLVGAPGSGKSNLALYLLTQLWRDHHVPFLVLDPSTGNEYRYLYGEPAVAASLVVYSVGDDTALPFRFNPFEVPPGITVRAHITRLLSCFKAAYEMWDPLPAIYEAALVRVYTSPPFECRLDEKRTMGEEDTEKPSARYPCMADFARAVVEELEEKVLPDYGKGTEASGVLTGASKIRVNSILDHLGHILNVRESDPNFFQRLLTRPTVLEFGALGDPSSISLIIAFLVIQLAGHIEAAAHRGVRRDHPHLILIEEAHRLLSAETSATTGLNQGNTRGKSAEELNTLLAEMRKFRQGIMVLDQRPSSLVGGVLDNAFVTIMCRLNDRVGFEHLSNVLNLDGSQRNYARTRLKAGDALMVDPLSGQPVLLRPPNVVDVLRARYSEMMAANQIAALLQQNATNRQLHAPDLAPTSAPVASWQVRLKLGTEWANLAEEVERSAEYATMVRLLESRNWSILRRAIRTWLTERRGVYTPLLEQTLCLLIAQRVGADDSLSLLEDFRLHLTGSGKAGTGVE